jgi:hypothetical protein
MREILQIYLGTYGVKVGEDIIGTQLESQRHEKEAFLEEP